MINALRFADNIDFCVEIEDDLQNILSNVHTIIEEKYGKRLNKKNT